MPANLIHKSHPQLHTLNLTSNLIQKATPAIVVKLWFVWVRYFLNCHNNAQRASACHIQALP